MASNKSALADLAVVFSCCNECLAAVWRADRSSRSAVSRAHPRVGEHLTTNVSIFGTLCSDISR